MQRFISHMMAKSTLTHTPKALLESLNMRRISRYHHTEVQSIERNNGYYSVYTDQQPLIEARKIIVAGGAWSSQLLKITIFIEK